ncbi:MAG: hypothetical protein EPN48_18445 [Microbacteriaceae bacterium]|nr:MAG: hypothetical protein EPN48_18445 [Microbacteriaceae bacterium]
MTRPRLQQDAEREAYERGILDLTPPAERDYIAQLLSLRNEHGQPLGTAEFLAIALLHENPLVLIARYALYERLYVCPDASLTDALKHHAGWDISRSEQGPPTSAQIDAAVRWAASACREEMRANAPESLRVPPFERTDRH